MSLLPGERLGHYEVLGELGRGGMGAVYRARDTRLGREVALKVSAQRFNERFEREARLIASLNHPNICTLYDVGPDYLVMELIEGESPKGPLPLQEALRIARQIGSALEAAHEKNITHRDLKPSNIKLKPDGTVKVLDFGLAKRGPVDGNPEDAETLSLSLTEAGAVLGTAAYMAPEQAQGKPVDKRADVWAFGVVLYELLAGRRLFRGSSVSDVLAAVLKDEPDWTKVPPEALPLLRRCLEKDPQKRLRDIGEAPAWMEHTPLAAAVPTSKFPWAWSIAIVSLLLAAVSLWFLSTSAPQTAAVFRLQIPLTVTPAAGGTMGLSPDGRHLAFAGVGADGTKRIWLRSMDSLETRPLLGTEYTQDILAPFIWSPDSRFIAFDHDRKLTKIEIATGSTQVLCDLPGLAVGGSWNSTGDIIFGTDAPGNSGILRVSEAGGKPEVVTQRDGKDDPDFHVFPQFLSDGRRFIYSRSRRAYWGSLDNTPDGQSQEPLSDLTMGVFMPGEGEWPSQWLSLRGATLTTREFDEATLQVKGEPVEVAGPVGNFVGYGFFGATQRVLVYRAASQDSQLTWLDRSGKRTGNPIGDAGPFGNIELSPDGTQLAASLNRGSTDWNLWLIDILGGGRTRLTLGMGRDDYPVWSGGRQLIYSSSGAASLNAGWNLRRKQVGTGQESTSVLESGETKFANAVSPDGQNLLYTVLGTDTKNDLWVLPLEANGAARKIATSTFSETGGQFSPDGKWIAYVSDESSQEEIYVQSFPEGNDKRVVSRGGGSNPRWRGSELFYVTPMGAVMVATPLKGGDPVNLFAAPLGGRLGDVSADGKRFLFAMPAGESAQAPFTVVLNWRERKK